MQPCIQGVQHVVEIDGLDGGVAEGKEVLAEKEEGGRGGEGRGKWWGGDDDGIETGLGETGEAFGDVSGMGTGEDAVYR